jgi:hypothetical protein
MNCDKAAALREMRATLDAERNAGEAEYLRLYVGAVERHRASSEDVLFKHPYVWIAQLHARSRWSVARQLFDAAMDSGRGGTRRAGVV